MINIQVFERTGNQRRLDIAINQQSCQEARVNSIAGEVEIRVPDHRTKKISIADCVFRVVINRPDLISWLEGLLADLERGEPDYASMLTIEFADAVISVEFTVDESSVQRWLCLARLESAKSMTFQVSLSNASEDIVFYRVLGNKTTEIPSPIALHRSNNVFYRTDGCGLFDLQKRKYTKGSTYGKRKTDNHHR